MLSRSDVGAWVFKGNPRKMRDDYFGSLESRERERGAASPSAWTVTRSARSDLIAKDDLFVLWISGSEEPGIYELGFVTRDPEPAEGLVDERAGATKPALLVSYRALILRDHIPRAAVRAHPVLGGCEQIRVPIRANPSYLTLAERDALLDQLSAAERRTAGWTPGRLGAR